MKTNESYEIIIFEEDENLVNQLYHINKYVLLLKISLKLLILSFFAVWLFNTMIYTFVLSIYFSVLFAVTILARKSKISHYTVYFMNSCLTEIHKNSNDELTYFQLNSDQIEVFVRDEEIVFKGPITKQTLDFNDGEDLISNINEFCIPRIFSKDIEKMIMNKVIDNE